MGALGGSWPPHAVLLSRELAGDGGAAARWHRPCPHPSLQRLGDRGFFLTARDLLLRPPWDPFGPSQLSPRFPPPPPFFVLFSPLQSFSILFWPCALQEGRVQFPPTPTPTLQPHGHTTDLGPPPTSSQHFFPLFVSVLFFKQSYLYCRFVTPQRWSAPGLLWGPLEITRVLLESAVSHCGFWAGWWRRRGVVGMGAMGAMGTCLRSA